MATDISGWCLLLPVGLFMPPSALLIFFFLSFILFFYGSFFGSFQMPLSLFYLVFSAFLTGGNLWLSLVHSSRFDFEYPWLDSPCVQTLLELLTVHSTWLEKMKNQKTAHTTHAEVQIYYGKNERPDVHTANCLKSFQQLWWYRIDLPPDSLSKQGTAKQQCFFSSAPCRSWRLFLEQG